jgi:hypothetical protein
VSACASAFVYASYRWPCANISGTEHEWHRTTLPHVFAEPGFLPLLEWLDHEQAHPADTASAYPGPLSGVRQ